MLIERLRDSSFFKIISFIVLFGICVFVAVILRTYDLEFRPLHSDEGVNFYFIKKTLENWIYPYSHKNYHGPAFFYLSSFFVSVLGESIAALRSSSVICSLFLVFSPIILFKRLEGRTIFLMSLVLVLSPSLVFFSRYAICESFFVLLSFLISLLIINFIYTKKNYYLYLISFLGGVLISIKETFIISFFSLALASFFEVFFNKNKEEAIFLLKKLFSNLSYIFLVCSITTLLIFSSFFRSIKEVREGALGVFQWVFRGVSDEGHFKPFYYYIRLIYETEPFLLLSILGFIFLFAYLIIEALKNKGDFLKKIKLAPGLIFFGSYSFFIFLVYSFIPYKTPWLSINITTPLEVFYVYFLVQFFEYKKVFFKILAIFLLTLHTFIIFFNTVKFNYDYSKIGVLKHIVKKTYPYQGLNPYSYVHTSSDFLNFIYEVKNYLDSKSKSKVLIACNYYWPSPYYLKDYSNKIFYMSFFELDKKKSKDLNYEIVVLDKGQDFNLKGYNRKEFRLSDVQEVSVWFKK